MHLRMGWMEITRYAMITAAALQNAGRRYGGNHCSGRRRRDDDLILESDNTMFSINTGEFSVGDKRRYANDHIERFAYDRWRDILNNLLKDTQFSHVLGRNPYGLYHFGDPDFKEIFKSGEPRRISRPCLGLYGENFCNSTVDLY